MNAKEIENGTKSGLDFAKLTKVFKSKINLRIMPVVVQNAKTKEVLFSAYVNKKALRYALKSKVATFWSTSRKKLWIKGVTSGDILELVKYPRVNCEQNSLLYLVRPVGKNKGVCHTKDKKGKARRSCYYRRIADDQFETLTFIKGRK
jgi:phosphoribosyl-AMP cyclohydrolase